MGRYEARPGRWRHRIARRAKAVWAGVAALVVGELVLVLSDTGVIEWLKTVLPPALAPVVPLLAAGIIFAVTHQAPANEPADASASE